MLKNQSVRKIKIQSKCETCGVKENLRMVENYQGKITLCPECWIEWKEYMKNN